MADVTLTVGSTIFTFTDGDVHRVTSDIMGKPEQGEISSTGPMSAYLYDYDGVLKTITISGALTPASSTRVPTYSIDTIVEQKQWLESIINGSQEPLTFSSTFESLSIIDSSSATPPYKGGFTYTKAMVESVKFEEEVGNPNRLPFTMILLVGTS